LKTSPAGAWWERLSWGVPLGVFVLCRTFSGLSKYGLGSDALAYLSLARRFPSYRLYGGSLYLLHPPIYVYLIGLLSRLIPLVTSGLLVTQAAAIAVFFLIKKYADLHGLSPAGRMVALLYVAMLSLSIAWDGQISRYSSLVAVIGIVLVGVEIYLRTEKSRTGRAKWMLGAAAASLLAFLTTDQALVLFPCVIVCFVCSRQWNKWRGIVFLLICMTASASIWPAVRWRVYATHRTYPAGIDGIIEPVGQSPWPAVIQPNLLPNTAANNAKFMGAQVSLEPTRWDRLWHEPLHLTIPWPDAGRWVVGFLAIAGVLRARSWGVTQERVWYKLDEPMVVLKLLLLFLLLYWPAVAGLYPWYGLAFVVPFAVLVGRGADGLLQWAERIGVRPRWVVVCLAGLSVAFSGDWLLAKEKGPFVLPDFFPPGAHFFYTSPVIYQAQRIGKQLAAYAPGERFMAPVGWVDPLIFDANIDVLGLPFDPALLTEQITEYHVRLLVLPAELVHQHFGGPLTRRYTSQEIAQYIDSHPAQYPLAVILKSNGETFCVYGVR
jgi:hypothetical protein